MITIPYLEIEATESCNLQCYGCLHFSNFSLKNKFSNRQRMKWVYDFFNFLKKDMKRQFVVDIFRVVGGEPFLNKELANLVGLLVYYKRQKLINEIIICTNGIAKIENTINKLSDFNKDIIINISLHADNSSYNKKIQEFTNLLKKYQITFTVENYNPSTWRINFNYKDNKIYPANSNSAYKSWKNCESKDCKTLLEDKIYFCPPIAHLPKVLEKTKQIQEEVWEPYLDTGYFTYRNLSYDEFYNNIFLDKEQSFCTMCAIEKSKKLNSYPIYKKDYD